MWLLFGVICLLANTGTLLWNISTILDGGSNTGWGWFGVCFAVIGILASLYIIGNAVDT
ncbi:hypothetical protein PP304_gp203 [Gordonia phage Phendrix]|uniref:Uncharacterized protein n=2 Tax=Godonkavirus TaxID=2733178 RepID=A0A4D6E461_9CAUD|nr:hypothetical protein HOV33_gp211 [Gordonia phage GodonK]YP_010649164.1 hypothetical protein PP304_gp203 [Gordonia phage Phendrix]QBZ72745.1 hypothetical protein SEA_GODONK_138 [Gordonia phage GodonK]QDK02668.1 hypothetical protein SEA_PHENDRIX_132 [Gordonia phage Phendrix]